MGVKPIKDKQALTADGEKALPTAAANNVKNLSIGSTGEDVVKLQKALNIDADGIFGPQTQQAVINYQKANGLDPDGIAGELTLGKLYGTTANNTVPPATSKPPTAKPEPEAPAPSAPAASSNPVTSPTNTANGNTGAELDPMSDPLVKQAWDIIMAHQANRPGDLVDPYKDKYMGYLDQFESRDPFSYDFNSDALYNQYKDQYIQQGRMAMMDTMGQAAALTGGYGNSYAQTAGQQAYNQQLGQLNEIMPELYDRAYGRYQQEGQEMLAMHDLYKGLSDQSYEQYMDSVDNWYKEDTRLRENFETIYDQTEDAMNRAANEKANAKSELIYLITQTGYDPTKEELDAAGLSPELAKAYKNEYISSRSSSGGNTPAKYTGLDYETQQKWFKGVESWDGLASAWGRMRIAGHDPMDSAELLFDYAIKNKITPTADDFDAFEKKMVRAGYDADEVAYFLGEWAKVFGILDEKPYTPQYSINGGRTQDVAVVNR